jgi:transposase
MSDKNFSPNDLGISENDWQQTPPAVRAALGTLHGELAKIKEQLNLNSDTSSKPPSSDKPRRNREKKGKLPSGKKRGAQPGHKGNRRQPKPPDQVNEFRSYQPEACGHCGEALRGEDANPYRWQVTEIPPVKPIVIEHQVHTLRCTCGKTTRGQLPPNVATSQFGPRLTALVGMLVGQERLSKRAVKRVLKTLFDVDISVGGVVARQREVGASLAEPYEAVATHVKTAASRNIDETPWRESWGRAWLWGVVSAEATLFHISPNRKRATAEALLGNDPDATTTSDRFTAYNRLDPQRHQTCWAHLLRAFRRFQLRDGPSAQVGGMLEMYGDYLLHRWREVKRGHLSRDDFLAEVPQHQADMQRWLETGACLDHEQTAGTCRRLLRSWLILWTFTRYDGVEPTNNAVERALRHGVIWRKLSYGTASADGSRFVERILTVIATARQQGIELMRYLTDAMLAQRAGLTVPALL